MSKKLSKLEKWAEVLKTKPTDLVLNVEDYGDFFTVARITDDGYIYVEECGLTVDEGLALGKWLVDMCGK